MRKDAIHPDTAQAIIEMYQQGERVKDTARKFGIAYGTVFKILTKYNIPRRGSPRQSEYSRRYNLDPHVFDQPLSHEAAYWTGFLMADGYNDGKNLRLNLSGKDADHLVAFCSFMHTNKPIGHYTVASKYQVAYVQLTHRHLCRQLASLGIATGRPNAVEAMNQLTNGSFPHWLRGLFDGDGHASGTTIQIVGKPDLMISVRQRVTASLGVYPAIIREFDNVTVILWHPIQTQEVLFPFMYPSEDVPCLERKKNAFKAVLVARISQRRLQRYNLRSP